MVLKYIALPTYLRVYVITGTGYFDRFMVCQMYPKISGSNDSGLCPCAIRDLCQPNFILIICHMLRELSKLWRRSIIQFAGTFIVGARLSRICWYGDPNSLHNFRP